jgi:surface protein
MSFNSVTGYIKFVFNVNKDIDNSGQVTIVPVVSPSNATVSYDWGAGNGVFSTGKSSNNTQGYTYTDQDTNTYTVIIGPNSSDGSTKITSFRITQGIRYLESVTSFGNVGLTSLENAFNGAINLGSVPSTLPTDVTNLNSTFAGCVEFNSSNVSGWDTSKVTTMIGTFSGCSVFNQPLNWTTSKVTDMSYMFSQANAFNQSSIKNWDTSSVTNMAYMFNLAKSFNQSLVPSGNIWNTSKVTSMGSMFNGASNFNGNVTLGNSCIQYWNISSIKPGDPSGNPLPSTSMVNMITNIQNDVFTNTNYDNLLISWDTQAKTKDSSGKEIGPYNVTLYQSNLSVSTLDATNALASLKTKFKWTITNTGPPK